MSRPAPGPDFVLRGHAADVQAICFHPEADLLYSGDAAGVLRVWSLDTRRTTAILSLHPPEAGILTLHFLQLNICQLLSQGRDGSIKCWDVDDAGNVKGSPSLELQTFSYNFCRCIVLPQSLWPPASVSESTDVQDAEKASISVTLIAMSGSQATDVELWNIEAGRLARTLTQPEGMKSGMCMCLAQIQHQKGCLLLAGYEDGTMALWDASQPNSPLTRCKPHAEPIMTLVTHESVAFSGSAEDFLQKLSIDLSGPTLILEKQLSFKEPGISDLAKRADGRIVASAGWDKKLRLYSTKQCRPLAVLQLQYHRASIAAIVFHPRTGQLVSAARDSAIAFWTVFSGN